MNPHPAAPSPANLTAAQGRLQRWLGPDVPIPQEKGLSALEQRSGLEGPLCTEAGPPAPGSTTEWLPSIRLRQGVGQKTQGQLASTAWVQPCWSSTGTDEREAAFTLAAAVANSFLGS